VKGKGRGRPRVPYSSAKATKAALESSPLVQDVIKPLEERGFLAASLSSGAKKWQGIILLPSREDNEDGAWEERRVRLDKIEKGEGEYRRMDIKWVF
jgi:DNA polymerase beta